MVKNKNIDIVKSNALVEACYHPASLNQMRLLLAALTGVKAGEKLSHKTEIIITAGALAEMTGTTIRANYGALKLAADQLFEMYVTVRDKPNGDGKVPARYIKKRVVNYCAYDEGMASVTLSFAPAILPYISVLNSHFTAYKASQVMAMRSSYGIRLYELCLQWLGFGTEREFTVAEFKALFGLENKYKRLDKIKDKIIKPALRDINQHSDLEVIFGQRKAGRVITHFQFKISRKGDAAQSDIFIERSKKNPAAKNKGIHETRHVLNKKYIEDNSKPGESWEQATARLSDRLSSEANSTA